MPRFRLRISNNILAALAILLIAISLTNFFVALNVVENRRMEAAAAGVGQIKLCASFTPNITAEAYHELVEDTPFYYDVNLSEKEDQANFSDDVSNFDIDSLTGVIIFTPTDSDVGEWNATIIATETNCNTFQDVLIMTFNVSSVNDPPVLISLLITNESSNGTNATYYFPITEPIDLYEDVWYNLSVIARDDDLPNETLTYGIVWLSPPTGFFVLNSTTGNATFMPVQSEVGFYRTTIGVVDSFSIVDWGDANFTIHNVNDPPIFMNKTVIRSQTAYSGEPYYLEVNASDEDNSTLFIDVEFIDCNQTMRNVSDQNCSIFKINHTISYPTHTAGVITFLPFLIDIGNYTVNYTVNDGSGGWDWQLGNFTVVEYVNHKPNITDWYPRMVGVPKNVTQNVTMSESESMPFNITVYDSDCGWGCSSVRWYIDSVELVDYQNDYEFTFVTDYKDSGIYNFTVVVSDGELTDSVEWRVVVLNKEPPEPPPRGGGGMLGGVVPCTENWRCTVWSTCSKEGLQIRACVDLSGCNTTFNRPSESRFCTYTPSPNCYDGIKNCHGGLCELLTDCGGPCPPCPTCSDGIKNCHLSGECEERADCGGPCPPCPELPHVAVCGNEVCEAGELYTCMEDCIEFWIDTAIFILIIILLIIVSILLYVYKRETVLLYVYRRIRGE